MTRALAGAMLLLLLQRAPAGVLTVDQLVTNVIGPRHDAAVRFNATLTHSTKGSDRPENNVTRQLVAAWLRDGGSTMMSYRQTWPVVLGGRVVVIAKTGDRRLHGFLYEGGRVTTLTDARLGTPFFDSDLILEDVAENFWYWTSRERLGEEAVGAYGCVIVGLRPPAGYAGTYSTIKAWLSPELALALRLDQFTPEGRFAKRISLYRELRLGDRWVPAIATAEPAGGRTRTVLEGTRYDPEARLTAADFTVAAVRKQVAAGR